jgi:hypothetical protein
MTLRLDQGDRPFSRAQSNSGRDLKGEAVVGESLRPVGRGRAVTISSARMVVLWVAAVMVPFRAKVGGKEPSGENDLLDGPLDPVNYSAHTCDVLQRRVHKKPQFPAQYRSQVP